MVPCFAVSEIVTAWTRSTAQQVLDALAAVIPEAWLHDPATPLGWLIGLSVAMFVGSLFALPLLVARMRSDYFLDPDPGEESWAGRHPVIRFAMHTVKNAAGLVLVVVGIAMLVLPGQGILTILAGITLLNFPGKRRLELAIVRRRPVRRGIEWIRKRANRPPLILPGDPRPPANPGR